MNEQYRGFAALVDRAMVNALASGASVAQIVLTTGVTASTLYRWRSGDLRSSPDPVQVRRFSDGLNVSITELHKSLGWWDEDFERTYTSGEVARLRQQLTELHGWLTAVAGDVERLVQERDDDTLDKTPPPQHTVPVDVAIPVVAQAIMAHISSLHGMPLKYSCSCGEWSKEISQPEPESWFSEMPVHREHRALAVLSALHDAGLITLAQGTSPERPARDITEGSRGGGND